MEEDNTTSQPQACFPLFRIWLCGPFRVERRVDTAFAVLPTKEWGGSNYPRLLLKALLVSRNRQARREALQAMLWPDHEPEQAAQNLNIAATKLRQVLRPTKGQESLLMTEDDSTLYRLPKQTVLWVDVDEAMNLFNQVERIQSASQDLIPFLEQAGEYLGRGRFLEEEDGMWATGRRATIERTAYRSRLQLAEAYLGNNEPGPAERILSFMLEDDPTDEDTLCRLIRLLHQQGRTHQALQLYKQTVTIFAKEGMKLTEGTKALVKRIEHERSLSNISETIQLPRIIRPSPHQQNELFAPRSDIMTQDVIETIRFLERTTDLNSSDVIKRRALLAHLLGISPAFLAAHGQAIENLTDVMKTQEETLSSLYEDMLMMGWDSFRRSKSPLIINKIDEHVSKLTDLARSSPARDAKRWQSLLCRFSQLSTRVAQHRMDEPRALNMAKQSIILAIDLESAELIASAFYVRARVYMEYSNTTLDVTQKRKHFERAKADIDAALGYVDRVRVPLAGNIYLLATEIYALLADTDLVLRSQCEAWQDKVAAFVDNDNIEEDGTFLKLNPTALRHERAKTFLHFGRVEAAHRELDKAWKTLQPNLFTWHMNMHLTQARVCLAERNIEESAQSSLDAYKFAKTIHSHKGEVEVKQLLGQLEQLDRNNVYVRNLTMTIERG